MPHPSESAGLPGLGGALTSVGSGLLAFTAADIQTLLVGLTGVIGGLAAAGFQYFRYWVDQKNLAAKTAEAVARADRAEKAAEDAKAELKQFMLDQMAEYRQYRHDGPDADVNRRLVVHEAQLQDATRAVNTNAPAIKKVADAIGLPVRVAEPVESLIDELPKSRD